MIGANRRRIEWIDAARGLAMCMIVFGHSVPGGFLKQLFYAFHVPVFFFLSGLVFHGDRQKSFGTFLVKEFQNLMLPYYGAGILSIGIYLLFGKLASLQLHVPVKGGGFFCQIGGMLYGNCKTGYMKWNLPLWFLPCLFMVSLMAWLLLRGIEKAEENTRTGWLGLVIGFLMFFGVYLTDKRQVAMLPMGLETGIRMLPFFLAGTEVAWTMKNMEKSGRKTLAFLADKPFWKKTALSISCLVFLGICILSAKQNSLILYHRDRYGQEGLFYLGAVSGICLIIGAGMLFERCKWILYMGQHTMWILLFHKFPLLFFQVLVPGMGKMLEESNPAAGMFVSSISIAVCLVMEAAGNELRKKLFPFYSNCRTKSPLDKRKGI